MLLESRFPHDVMLAMSAMIINNFKKTLIATTAANKQHILVVNN